MSTYRVMVTQNGYANVEAPNEAEALKKVDSMRDSDFDWDTNWSSEDAVIVDKIDDNN